MNKNSIFDWTEKKGSLHGEVVTKITLLSILAIIFYSANSFSNSNCGKCFLATLP